jgi:hypothetical protein
VKDALAIDLYNKNTAWKDAIATELKRINYYKTFRTFRKSERLTDFQLIPYQLVFDVKFDLPKEARLVAGEHCTTPPKEDLYSGVVDLMTVRIGHLIAASNELKVCEADLLTHSSKGLLKRRFISSLERNSVSFSDNH